jgi:large subunit ribosomal protein L32e
MEEIKNLLKLRKKIKGKKPTFIRQDAHKKKKLGRKWRKPKGLHSKLRLKFKGHHKPVSKGFGSPKKVRGTDRQGLKIIVVNSIKDIEKIKDNESIIIAKRIGAKKKIELLKSANEKGVTISNIKNVEEYIKQLEAKLKERKEKREKALKERKEKKKSVKEKKEKEGLAKKISEEEKKKEEKKEKDKILTKKDM